MANLPTLTSVRGIQDLSRYVKKIVDLLNTGLYEIYNVGDVIQNTTGLNPSTYLGYGTWESRGSSSLGLSVPSPLLSKDGSTLLSKDGQELLGKGSSGSTITIYFWERVA